jgi:hypothetical protein
MERDQAAALNDGWPAVPDLSEADRIRATYPSYDTQARIRPLRSRYLSVVTRPTA